MTAFVGWIAPPGVAVVAPPVHPKTFVNVIYSDRDEAGGHAGDLNWSSVGDGPAIVAYSVVQECKPAPELRERWAVGAHLRNTFDEAQDFLDTLRRDHPGMGFDAYRVIHVREVPDPSREVVAWAVVRDSNRMLLTSVKDHADTYAAKHGGTVIRLTGVKPS